jgi:ketosteroid isomerase-like protein
MRVALLSFAFIVTACSPAGSVTVAERNAAIAQISVVFDSINAAWRRADFPAVGRTMLDEGLTTDNGNRSSNAAARARAAKNPTGGLAGQYISRYTPRYDVLSPDVAVTSSENDFARIGLDKAQEPMQVALMTIVWKRTDDGWRMLYYHESTRPKELKPPAQLLSPYAGNYLRSDGSAVRFTVVDGALDMTLGRAAPTALEAFTEPNFGRRNGLRVTFVRNRDRTVHGVLLVGPDGSSTNAWRAPTK